MKSEIGNLIIDVLIYKIIFSLGAQQSETREKTILNLN